MANANDLLSQMQSELDKYLTDTLKVDTKDVDLDPTGIKVLDMLLGGGVGLMTLLVGNPGSLKSTLCGNIASNFQKLHPDGLITYIDTEHSMSPTRLAQLGLQNIKPKTNMTVEDVFKIIEAIVLFKEEKNLIDKPSLVIWDSIASTPANAELTAAEPKEVIGMKARIISLMLPKILNLIHKYNIKLLAVNQLRDKISIGQFAPGADLRHLGQDMDMPGGKALKFAATQLLHLKVTQSFDDITSPFGERSTTIQVKTVKNKYFADNFKISILSLATHGFNDTLSSYLLLKDMKLLVAASWSYLKNYPQKKFRLKELLSLYNSDTVFKQAFDSHVKEAIEIATKKMVNYEEFAIGENPIEEYVSEDQPVSEVNENLEQQEEQT